MCTPEFSPKTDTVDPVEPIRAINDHTGTLYTIRTSQIEYYLVNVDRASKRTSIIRADLNGHTWWFSDSAENWRDILFYCPSGVTRKYFVLKPLDD